MLSKVQIKNYGIIRGAGCASVREWRSKKEGDERLQIVEIHTASKSFPREKGVNGEREEAEETEWTKGYFFTFSKLTLLPNSRQLGLPQ